MKNIINLAILLFIFSGFGIFAHGQEGTIVLNLDGIRNSQGDIRLALYASKDGFPSDYQKAVKLMSLPADSGEMKVTMSEVAPGEYAVAVLHDENKNDKMDTNFFKMPKEGYATSRNAKGKLGPPKFKDAKFMLSADTLTFTIHLQY